jgi:hypothetical protein
MTEQTQHLNKSHKRGWKTVVTSVTMMTMMTMMRMTTMMMKPRSDRVCGGGEWRAAATATTTAVAVAMIGCFGNNITRHLL